jgi:hypothetical protein
VAAEEDAMAGRTTNTRKPRVSDRRFARKGTVARLRRWPALVALLLALTVVAAACGGGNGDNDESPTDSGSGGASAFGESAVSATRQDDLAGPSFGASAPRAGSNGDFGGDGDGFASADILGRSIIRSASIGLEVDSVGVAFDQTEAIALGAGGFVADSSFFGREDERSASVTLRVPATGFGDVMQQLRGLAVEVTSIKTSAQDVTEEFTDIEAQLSNLRSVEARYLELLADARGISEILQVQDRIDGVRLQIDRLEGRVRLLGDLTELATINVSLTPVPVVVGNSDGGSGPLAAAGDAWQASLNSIEAVTTVVLVAVVYSWWLLPFALVLVFVGVRMRDRITFARDDGKRA